MAEDYVNIRLSAKASDIASRIEESKFFESRISVAKFAMAYAIKYHFDEIDPLEIDSDRDATGSNYNVGTVDGDKFISKFIEALYPENSVLCDASERIHKAHIFHSALRNNKSFLGSVEGNKNKRSENRKRCKSASVIGHSEFVCIYRKQINHKRHIYIKNCRSKTVLRSNVA